MLLFALKIKFPTRVFLIRGNHEDRFIYQTYGFYSEMNERFPDGVAVKLWEKINDVFDCLPIAALISDRILCVHGGTGQLESLEDIEKIKRPLRFSQNDETSLAAFHNILWSDPTDGPSEIGFHPNPARGTGIVKFGPDIVKQFIKKNNLDLIIRAHQACSAGYEFFAGGHLITVFSATNYCGKHGNNGAMLYISSELQIRPKIVKPKNEHLWPATQSAPPSPPRSPRI
ncbi:Serine/threonine-protein phosphatase bsl1 [Basidiobolus ranarum]|uniref:Serine/threonine-protein phosphatase n=1 Tax=Basidiobolus ranarum TaxID=34480 RepID=A0ABR2VMJ7_9FUNG